MESHLELSRERGPRPGAQQSRSPQVSPLITSHDARGARGQPAARAEPRLPTPVPHRRTAGAKALQAASAPGVQASRNTRSGRAGRARPAGSAPCQVPRARARKDKMAAARIAVVRARAAGPVPAPGPIRAGLFRRGRGLALARVGPSRPKCGRGAVRPPRLRATRTSTPSSNGGPPPAAGLPRAGPRDSDTGWRHLSVDPDGTNAHC